MTHTFRSSRLGQALFYGIYLALSTLLLIVSLEGVVRFVIHLHYGHSGKTYGLWRYDPELGADHRPNGYNSVATLNNFGFRNLEDVFQPKPPDGLRILAFGGSTTFGYNLADGQTYTEKLQEKLRTLPEFGKTQVLNAGRINYSAGHNLILMKRLAPQLKPDYVILYEGVNELQNAWVLQRDGVSLNNLGETYKVLGKSYDQNRWLKRNSTIVRLIDYYVKPRAEYIRQEIFERHRNSSTAKVEIHPWIIRNYRYVFEQIIRYLQEEKVKIIVVRYATFDHPELKAFADLSAEVAREKGVLICDMQSRFDQFGVNAGHLFIHTGAHVNSEGAKVLAQELYETILLDLKMDRHS